MKLFTKGLMHGMLCGAVIAILWGTVMGGGVSHVDSISEPMGPGYPVQDCVQTITGDKDASTSWMYGVSCADSTYNFFLKYDPTAQRYVSGEGSNAVRPTNYLDPQQTGSFASFFQAASDPPGGGFDECPFNLPSQADAWCDANATCDQGEHHFVWGIQLVISGRRHFPGFDRYYISCSWQCNLFEAQYSGLENCYIETPPLNPDDPDESICNQISCSEFPLCGCGCWPCFSL